MYKNLSFGKWMFMATACVLFFVGMGQSAAAKQTYQSPDTGYVVLVEDDADLLTDQEEADLALFMEGITAYGSAAFKTIDENPSTTRDYIENYYQEQFGSGSGTVFLVDMDNRNIWIYSNGAIYRVITDSYADIITDNIYSYASDGDYYKCSHKAFQQILALLQGNKIAKPMKYISNALLALTLALFICYFVVKSAAVAKKPSKQQLLKATKHTFRLTETEEILSHTTKKYDPPSSSGDSGGGSSGGGGGGGGGGGHSF